MADEFGTPTRRTTTTAYEPVVDEPVVYTETTYDTAYDTTYSESGATGTGDTSTKDVAKEQAAQVGQGAADAGKHVAGVAKEQATGVASEAADQAKNLYDQTRQELKGQASTQQQRLAEGVRSLSSELESMANGGNAGPAADLVREASSRARDVAGWLDQRDPGALLQEVTDFARRRPGTFLAIAAGAGLIAGRLTRGAISEARHESSPTSTAGYAQPTPAPVQPAYDPTPYEPYERYEADGVAETPFDATAPVPGTVYPTERREGL